MTETISSCQIQIIDSKDGKMIKIIDKDGNCMVPIALQNENNVKVRVCRSCERLKPMEDFTKSKASKDNRRHRCKDCETAFRREYQREYFRKHYAKKKKVIAE